LALLYDNLTSFGVLRDVVSRPNFIDRELAHTYGYQLNLLSAHCILQDEEVQGIVRVKIEDCFKLWKQEVRRVYAEGYRISDRREKETIERWFTYDEFVPHSRSYYVELE